VSSEEKVLSLKTVIFFTVIICVFALFRFFFVYNPIDSAEGELAYFGKNTGTETMYAQNDTKLMPLTAYVYRAAFSFAGENPEAVRKLGVIYFLLTAALVFMAARTYFGNVLSLFAVFMYGLYQNTHAGGGLNAYPSYFSQIFLLLSFLFVAELEEGFENADYALSGIFIGAAFLTMAQAVFFIFVPLYFVLKREKSNALKHLLFLTAGFFAVIIAACIYMIKEGMLAGFGRAIAGQFSFYGTAGIADVLLVYLFGTAAFVISIIIFLFKKGKTESFPVLVSGICAIICGLIASIAGEKGPFLTAVPFLALSSALLLQCLKLDKDTVKNGIYIFILALIIIPAHFYTSGMKKYIGSAGVTEEKQYDSLNAAEIIKTSGAKSLAVTEGCREILFLSGIKPAGRNFYDGDADIKCVERINAEKETDPKGYGLMAVTKYYMIYGRGVQNEKNK
jgi:hypothetical protein